MYKDFIKNVRHKTCHDENRTNLLYVGRNDKQAMFQHTIFIKGSTMMWYVEVGFHYFTKLAMKLNTL